MKLGNTTRMAQRCQPLDTCVGGLYLLSKIKPAPAILAKPHFEGGETVHTQTVLAATPRADTLDPLFRKRVRFEQRAVLKLLKCIQPTSGVNHKFTDTEKGSTATLEVIQNAGSKSCYFFEIDYIAPPKSKRQKPPPN